jgi:hypothetical protein
MSALFPGTTSMSWGRRRDQSGISTTVHSTHMYMYTETHSLGYPGEPGKNHQLLATDNLAPH